MIVMTSPTSSLTDVLASLRLERVNATFFVGNQLPAPANHILGGHISAQAVMAAGQTAPGRAPHSVHTYFLRPGDARRPVDFEVTELQEGRTFSARRVTARQDGQVLLEAMSSFRTPGAEGGFGYQPPMPAVPEPDSLPYVAPHFAETPDTGQGQWASLRWFQRRIVDTASLPPARSLIWWRPDGEVPDDPALIASLVAYLSAVTLTEPAFAARPKMGPSAQRDHSVWFHGPAVLSDWLLYDQDSPSSADSLSLARGRMFNRNGDLVCTVGQEMYFPPPRV
jgi:acyl-CoA thioesterase II